ncbi:MAG: BatD family protein [Phycisphaerales bacterium]
MAWAPAVGLARQSVEPQVAISAESIDLGDSIVYQIALDGVSAATPPTLPPSDLYTAAFLGGQDQSSRSIMSINGKTTETNVLRYVMQWRITPLKTGMVDVPAFSFDVAGKSVSVPAARFRVTTGADNPNFKLTLEPSKSSGYVGEPLRFRLLWEVSGRANSATFTGPDGGSRYDVGAIDPRPQSARARPNMPGDPYHVLPFLNGEAVVTQTQITQGDRSVTVFVLDMVVTPKVAGKIEIGPYRVVVEEVVGQRARSPFDWPFGNAAQTRRSVITSNAVTLDIKPLPTEGKPADFGGLVGVYSIEAKSGNEQANVGDPVPLRVTIGGPEPLDSIKPPDLEAQSEMAASFKPGPEGWEKANTPGASSSEVTYTTTIRPKSASVTEIPPIRLPYFDTATGKYAVAQSKPIPIKVRASREVTAADALRNDAVSAAPAAKLTSASPGLSANSESPDLLTNQRISLLAFAKAPGGIVLFGAPPLLLAGTMIVLQSRKKQDPEKAARKAAIAKARQELGHARSAHDLLSVARGALSPFVGVSSPAVASCDASRAALTPETAALAARVLADLEAAAQRPSAEQPHPLKADLSLLLDRLSRA